MHFRTLWCSYFTDFRDHLLEFQWGETLNLLMMKGIFSKIFVADTSDRDVSANVFILIEPSLAVLKVSITKNGVG